MKCKKCGIEFIKSTPNSTFELCHNCSYKNYLDSIRKRFEQKK